jgi:xylan 1,4-beta-xylosidase
MQETKAPGHASRLGVLLITIGLIALYPVFLINGKGWSGNLSNMADVLSYRGGIVVELQGNSWPVSLEGRPIQGIDNNDRQAYKYKGLREGEDFHYVIAGLTGDTYEVELSFAEYAHSLPGGRVFNVHVNGVIPPNLASLDLCAKAGKERAYQVTVTDVSVPDGILDLRFEAAKGLAMVCHIRLITEGHKDLDIDTGESRHWSFTPLRFPGSQDQNVFEAILGRFGSRFMVNPAPQLLGWRQSPLGTWTGDLSEFVLAFRSEEGEIRCLPFTDRYPVFSAIDQQLSLTGITYTCHDPSLPFQAAVTLKAPFYPEDVKLSTAPFFYLEIEVSNPGESEVQGEILLARPHKDDNVGKDSPRSLKGSRGYKYTGRYTYGQESHVNEENNSGYFEFWEALAVDEPSSVNWHFEDIAETGWMWDSPPEYPQPRPFLVYSFIPRGYSGFDSTFVLDGNASQTITAVLACHTAEGVLEVRGEKGNRFLYNNPAGPNLGSVDAVVDYALGSERPSIEEKTAFFDTVLSDAYLSPLPQSGQDLAAVALQNFIINAWWCYDNWGREWFSVWEGEPYMYHSSIDVEYTNAFFYLSFWPDLLGKLLREWVTFEKELEEGKCLSHDMGVEHWVNGMAYPHDMPVEENSDYILLLYSYWKNTGDTAFMRDHFPHAREYTEFIFRCDTDGDGLPDIHVDNTIDQGSVAVQHARNQTYLGVKALASYRAASEMARAQEPPDEGFIFACEDRVGLINRTLEQKLWLGDHFAVCDDPDVPQAEREAYSLYASNGLLYLLAAGLDPALTAENIERFRQDIANAAARTSRRYGYVHTSVDNENQWVSQNLLRDALGYWLEVPGWAPGQADRLTRYWELQHYFATMKSGGFWDVCAYNPGREERHGSMRGPFLPEYAYDQSLGYYCRGVAFMTLPAAKARLRLDRTAGYLLYNPAYAPGRVPVFACADWGAEDPGERIPVLVFDGGGNLQETLNPHLLPKDLQRS